MGKPIMEQVADAKAVVPAIGADEVKGMLGRDDVLIVDVRDGTEVAASGKVKGAVHASRGVIEFQADPSSPMHKPEFSTDKTVIVYCASGGRSALAGKALKDLGYTDVRNLGGFAGWVEAGGEVEK
jgi:rhodanese-related sulfurtransferase